jgi:signal transduction histidine kinase
VTERGFLLTFGVLRAGVLLQVAVATVRSLLIAQPLWASVATVSVAVLWSVILFAVVGKRGSFAASPTWLCWLDFGVAMAALIVPAATQPPERYQITTWDTWGYAYACFVGPTFGAWVQPRLLVVIMAVAQAGTYVASVFKANRDNMATVAINGMSLIIFPVAAAVLCAVVRRVAQTADANQVRANQLERDRHRIHLHNVTGLLDRLAGEDTPPDMLPLLRRQAKQEARRLRNEVRAPTDAAPAEEDTPRSVEEVVLAALGGFGHLPLEVRTSLGRKVYLQDDDALAVQSALISVLYNVQFHAGRVTEVTVHVDSQGDDWEVSVCDDGVGFDPDNTTLGFGLQSQVLDAAESRGMTVSIDSTPGEGTCVFIRSPQMPAPSA